MNMLYDGTRDCYSPFSEIGFTGSFEDLKEKIQKSIDRYLPIFNQELKSNGTGYLIGSSVTMADAGLLEVLLATVDYFDETAFSDYPSIQKYLTMMRSRPEVMSYMENVRQRANDDRYITEVKAVLSHTSS